jgi:hypothetical protein
MGCLLRLNNPYQQKTRRKLASDLKHLPIRLHYGNRREFQIHCFLKLMPLFPQIESLKTQNAKLERIYELDSKRFQEQATSDKLRIESLIKQTTLLEGQLTTTQKSHADLSMLSSQTPKHDSNNYGRT